MGDNKHVRPYFDILRRLGAVLPSDLELRTPVQAVVQFENYERLIEPPRKMVYTIGSQVGADALEFSVAVEIQVRSPGGGWILNFSANNDCALVAGESARITTPVASPIPMVWSIQSQPAGTFDPVIQNRFVNGTTTVDHDFRGIFLGSLRALPFPEPIYVAHGKFIALMGRVVNQQVSGSILFQEIPAMPNFPV